MTVRTWFTISTIVVIALFGAVALKLSAPVNAPTIVVRSGDLRLVGHRNGACWPKGNGRLHCVGADPAPPRVVMLPRRGKLRVVVAYPLQPKQGYVAITHGRDIISKRNWTESFAYDVPPGTYQLIAYAKYPKSVFVQYLFAFRAA